MAGADADVGRGGLGDRGVCDEAVVFGTCSGVAHDVHSLVSTVSSWYHIIHP